MCLITLSMIRILLQGQLKVSVKNCEMKQNYKLPVQMFDKTQKDIENTTGETGFINLLTKNQMTQGLERKNHTHIKVGPSTPNQHSISC